jgi:hypothetical protein
MAKLEGVDRERWHDLAVLGEAEQRAPEDSGKRIGGE